MDVSEVVVEASMVAGLSVEVGNISVVVFVEVLCDVTLCPPFFLATFVVFAVFTVFAVTVVFGARVD